MGVGDIPDTHVCTCTHTLRKLLIPRRHPAEKPKNYSTRSAAGMDVSCQA